MISISTNGRTFTVIVFVMCVVCVIVCDVRIDISAVLSICTGLSYMYLCVCDHACIFCEYCVRPVRYKNVTKWGILTCTYLCMPFG